MEPGLSLTLPGGTQSVVKDTIDGAWLSKLAPGPNQAFVLSGSFDAPRADLYQLQIRTNTQAFVEISGVKIATVSDDKWHLIPVALKAGTHLLAIHGIAHSGATLDVRLGAAGALHLAEAQFKHPRR